MSSLNIFYSSKLPKKIIKISNLSKYKDYKLILITDFDRTITQGNAKQCHDYMTEILTRYLSYNHPDRLETFQKMVKEYPKSLDPWKGRHNSFISSKITQKYFEKSINNRELHIRDGVKSTFKYLIKNNIPVIIQSVGIEYIIERVIKHLMNRSTKIKYIIARDSSNVSDDLKTGIYITAHYIQWKKGVINDICPHIPDADLKIDFPLPFIEKVGYPNHITGVITGDNINDFNILKDNKNFIRVGFANDDSQKFKALCKICDVVIESSSNHYEIIKEIFNMIIIKSCG